LSIDLGNHVLGALEYCHMNFLSFFTARFWGTRCIRASLKGKRACYFNTGLMVIDLRKWKEGRHMERLESWMRV
jgi:lipopolysaccharide biosynthesis glycosyltransferase